MSRSEGRVTVVGAGLVGPLAALTLARRGLGVDLYEARPDPREAAPADGRSLHLVLSARAWNALSRVGLEEAVRGLCLPLRGRRIHLPGGGGAFQPYGADGQAIYAIHRHALHRALVGPLAALPGVAVRFGHRCVSARPEDSTLEIERVATGARVRVSAARVIAADGAHSQARLCLSRLGRFDHSREEFPCGYRQLGIPATSGGHWPLEPDGMHVWPRGRLMLVAFPNPDSSFSAVLFLPLEGEASFDSVRSPGDLTALFRSAFPDALPLMPDLVEEFFAAPPSRLDTIRCFPWSWGGRLALVGDAAHAMLPFLGQGMNAGFEDCVVLDECLSRRGGDWTAAFSDYENRRKPDCDAITELSLRNFAELADHVGDARFLLRKKIEARIHRLQPERFVPAYSMVAFTLKPYSEVLQDITLQEALLDRLLRVPGIEDAWDTPAFEELLQRHLEAPRRPEESSAAAPGGAGPARTT